MLVTEAMQRYYSAMAVEDDSKWDTRTLHASDLGFCPTSIWARRNGKNTLFVDLDNWRQRMFGKLWEQEVANALRFDGIPFEEQIHVKGNLFGVDIECHSDFDVPAHDLIIEAKTTEFWQGWRKNADGKSEKYTKIPDDVKPYHKLQAACSAALLGRRNFVIPNTDRAKGFQIEKTFETVDFLDELDSAIMERKDTGIGTPPPPPNPVYEWECKSCSFRECPKNENPFFQEVF